jgi:hypothetical protein
MIPGGDFAPRAVLSAVVWDGCVPAHAGCRQLAPSHQPTLQVHAHDRHVCMTLLPLDVEAF